MIPLLLSWHCPKLLVLLLKLKIFIFNNLDLVRYFIPLLEIGFRPKLLMNYLNTILAVFLNVSLAFRITQNKIFCFILTNKNLTYPQFIQTWPGVFPNNIQPLISKLIISLIYIEGYLCKAILDEAISF